MSAPTLTVCRGCCCGTAGRHRGIDPVGALARLRRAAGERARVRVSDCLGPCAESDVIVVSPSPAGRCAGGRPVWLGLTHGDAALADIAQWIADGGPGLAEIPPTLSLHQISAPQTAPRGLQAG